MSLASFALVIGVFCYVYGFPLVFGDDKHIAWRKKMMNDENMLRFAGALFLSVAVTTLKYQWRMTADGEGLMVAVAWIVFVKAVLLALWPSMYASLTERWVDAVFDNMHLQGFVGFVAVLLGALFTYMGLVLA